MRIALLGLLLAAPAFAEAPDLPGLEVDPAVLARLVPSVGRGGISDPDAPWESDRARIAAIVGPDGTLRETYPVAETFDDAPLAEDAALVQAVLDEM